MNQLIERLQQLHLEQERILQALENIVTADNNNDNFVADVEHDNNIIADVEHIEPNTAPVSVPFAVSVPSVTDFGLILPTESPTSWYVELQKLTGQQ